MNTIKRKNNKRAGNGNRSGGGFRSRNNSRPSSSGGGNRGGRKFNKGNRSRGKGNGQLDLNKYINKNVKLEEEKVYECVNTFANFGLHPKFQKIISGVGYEKPTEIQDKAIPQALMGHDVIGIAGTGTGKTAAFLTPIIQQLVEQPNNHHALIITPTRELATQIFDEFRKLTKGLNLFTTCLIGGSSVQKSMSSLRKTNHVIIGTPGRLMDMYNRKLLKLNEFKVLVLDEFDRMLDMGFSEDMEMINGKMVNKEQTLLFSATTDKSQQHLIDGMTDSPIKVVASVKTQKTSAIEQDIIRIPKEKKKMEVMQEYIHNWKDPKVMLFCETKRMVNDIYKNLRSANITTDMIHGDKTQKAREIALRKFKRGQVKVLVATDVVARGIDVNDVSLVINYEIPRNYNDYIHRIGRTGRAGKKGKAITLVD